MRPTAHMLIILTVLTTVSCHSARSQTRPHLADSVKTEFLHCWNAYKQYAWGHDALNPLSRTPRDWHRTSLLMTPVDAFDTMVLMGLTAEAAEAKRLILDSLTFDRDIEVQNFEITIRLLGGLLSAYQLDGDRWFLGLATDLANRLLPAYRTPTGMPYRFVNLRTGQIRDSINNPAEIGTSLLEFGTLSRLTGNPLYYETAKRSVSALFSRRSRIGLVGTTINVVTGRWVDSTSHIGGMIDSYYEYLLKASRLFKDAECQTMWEVHLKAINAYIADTAHGGLWYGQADMTTGRRTGTEFGSLEAFFPAVLCLAGDVSCAARLQESCYRMWTLHGIEPESIDYATMTATAKQYYLRPEIIESAYYLYQYTRDPRYLRMGETLFDNLRAVCRVPAGYAMLRDVTTKELADRMESFFFAETLKYFYLLFSPPGTFPFERVTFTTEAHPLRSTWKD